MKKRFLAVLLICAFVMAVGLTACSSGTNASSEASSGALSESSADASAEMSSETAPEAASEESSDEAAVEASAYGYAGNDPVEAAVFKYMAEQGGCQHPNSIHRECGLHQPTRSPRRW